MTVVKINMMENPLLGGTSDVAPMPPLPEDVEAFTQAMKSSPNDMPRAVTRQQGKTAAETTSSTSSQVQVSAEKPVGSTMAHQEKTVTQAAPSPNAQVQ
ncbi:MAG: hypothetical protein IJM72_04805, partial [Deltaproteobacteria bacterium]|nr:hypothetical protein [Deltaproteobacteria bacterium]